MRTIPNISENLKVLDTAITDHFIAALFKNDRFNDLKRELLALPIKYGGLDLIIPSKLSDVHHENSRNITKSLTDHVINQRKILNINQNEQKMIKQTVKNEKLQQNKETFERIKHNVSPTQKKILESISETGASSWLLALPIKDQGLYLDKQSFSDAINLRYRIDLLKLPMHCVCGSAFHRACIIL